MPRNGASIEQPSFLTPPSHLSPHSPDGLFLVDVADLPSPDVVADTPDPIEKAPPPKRPFFIQGTFRTDENGNPVSEISEEEMQAMAEAGILDEDDGGGSGSGGGSGFVPASRATIDVASRDSGWAEPGELDTNTTDNSAASDLV